MKKEKCIYETSNKYCTNRHLLSNKKKHKCIRKGCYYYRVIEEEDCEDEAV